jgi:coenzyme F420-reducing hydrogenase delta subunit
VHKIGNFTCERRVKFIQELLKNMGISEKRVQMHHVSAAEASKLAEIINTVSQQVIELNKEENK